VFGFPLLMAWIVFWVVVTSAVMGFILRLDHRAEQAAHGDRAHGDRAHGDRAHADREPRGP
jgi:hypothetical protein